VGFIEFCVLYHFLIQQHGHFYVFNQLGQEVDVGATQNYLVRIMPLHQTKKY